MELIKNLNGSVLNIALKGRLDTTTSPQLEEVFKNDTKGITELILNFEELDYISSAGLRVLLLAQKVMNKQGSMRITNVCENIMDVFEITGFVDILTIEG